MTVYVDDMRMEATVMNKGRPVKGTWSHLFADTIAELEEFARTLGMRPEWQQISHNPKRGGLVHYDLVESRRRMAVRLGAKEVSYRDLPDYLNKIERAPIT